MRNRRKTFRVCCVPAWNDPLESEDGNSWAICTSYSTMATPCTIHPKLYPSPMNH